MPHKSSYFGKLPLLSLAQNHALRGAIISLPSPQFSEEVVETAKKQNVDVSFLLVESNGEDMQTLSQYLDKGIIKAHVSATFSFDEMGKAHEQLESGRTVGKVVVTV